jgi:hypothetical protein
LIIIIIIVLCCVVLWCGVLLWFAQSFDTRGTLQVVRGHAQLGGFASELLREVRRSMRRRRREGLASPLSVPQSIPHIAFIVFCCSPHPQGPHPARKGVDAGDHPPLTPVGLPGYALSGDESRIFDLVVRHFLASLSRDARYLVTTAVFAAAPPAGMTGGERFSCRGKEEIDPGFMRVYGRDSHDTEVRGHVILLA